MITLNELIQSRRAPSWIKVILLDTIKLDSMVAAGLIDRMPDPAAHYEARRALGADVDLMDLIRLCGLCEIAATYEAIERSNLSSDIKARVSEILANTRKGAD